MSGTTPLTRPSRDDIALLPMFQGLALSHIHVVKSAAQVDCAFRALSESQFIGFDTESKPVFTRDAVRDGPHVIQFATLTDAFIVQLGSATPLAFLQSVIESSTIVKVGFGLKSDSGPLAQKLGIRLGATVDLSHAVRKLGYRQAVGIKAAVAIVLGCRLRKSRSTTTSNWAQARLDPNQLLYAAEDAYAALLVFHAMGMPCTSLPTPAPCQLLAP